MQTKIKTNKWKEYSRIERLRHHIPNTDKFKKYYGFLPANENPSNNSLRVLKHSPRVDAFDITLDANKLSQAERNEIADSTIVYLKGLSREEVYKVMKAEFNRSAALYHDCQVTNTRYLITRRYLEELNTPITLQMIPVWNEPNLDIRTRRYIDRIEKDYAKMLRKEQIIEIQTKNKLQKELSAQAMLDLKLDNELKRAIEAFKKKNTI